jgi:glutamate racemase
MNTLLKEYLTPMIKSDIDYLVLGCSHYPYLVPQIKKILPNHITIIDSGEAVARQTKKILEDLVGFRDAPGSQHVFYTNSNPSVLETILGNTYPVLSKDF